MLRLVEHEKEMAEAAAKRKAIPNVSPSTPTPSIAAYFFYLKNYNS